MRPSRSELDQAFGTSNIDKVIAFILTNGSFGKRTKKKGPSKPTKKEKALAANSRMHVPHSRAL